jgi:peptide/nickel transport system substrate-binding protein
MRFWTNHQPKEEKMKSIQKLERVSHDGKLTRREFISRVSALGAAVTLSPFLFGRLAEAAMPRKGGHFRIGMAGGATTDSLEPGKLLDHMPMVLQYQLKNNLVEIDAEGNAIPELAESWEPSADASQWTFKIRKNVEFHNGKTLTSEDVLYSLNFHRGKESKSAGKSQLESILDLKADDKYTVVVTLNGGNADFPFILSDIHFPIIPDGDEQFHIGTGGYQLMDFEPGVRAFVKRNPNYWKEGRAHFDEIETLVINDTVSRTNALKSDQIDAMNRCDLKTVHLLEKSPSLQLIRKTGRLHYYFPMRTDTDPFDNKDVRLALKYAINRQALLDLILKGYGALGNDHPIAPTYRYYNAKLPQRRYDPDKAKYHLKKAGMEQQVFKLHASNAAFAGGMDAAVLFKEYANKAGVKMEIVQEPADGYWSSVWMKKPWSMSYLSGRPTEDMIFSLQYAKGAAWNDTFWNNERFNKLLMEARSELNESKRREMYAEMQKLISDDGGVILPFFADNIDAGNKKVKYDGLSGQSSMDHFRCSERWWFA